MKHVFLIKIIVFTFLLCGCSAQKKASVSKAVLLKTIDQNFRDASSQYKLMMKRLPADRFPKTYYAQTDKFQTAPSNDWCSGFYPGTLLYLYEQTKDQSLLGEAERILKVLEKEKDNKTTHDLGFMMYCSYGNLNRIKPDDKYKQIKAD